MIYFLEAGVGGSCQTGFIKIGYTGQLAVRKPQLESRYGCRFRTLGIRPGFKAAEASAHREFADERYATTEFFRPSTRLKKFIREKTIAWLPVHDEDEMFDRVFSIMMYGPEMSWCEAVAESLGIAPVVYCDILDMAVRHFGQHVGIEFPELTRDDDPWAGSDETIASAETIMCG